MGTVTEAIPHHTQVSFTIVYEDWSCVEGGRNKDVTGCRGSRHFLTHFTTVIKPQDFK